MMCFTHLLNVIGLLLTKHSHTDTDAGELDQTQSGSAGCYLNTRLIDSFGVVYMKGKRPNLLTKFK
jgi:hypothetical protein